VSGQNSNNSVRVPDGFLESVLADGGWQTTFRTTGEVHRTLRGARELWRKVARGRLGTAPTPAVQYDDTIQKWHTQGDRPVPRDLIRAVSSAFGRHRLQPRVSDLMKS